MLIVANEGLIKANLKKIIDMYLFSYEKIGLLYSAEEMENKILSGIYNKIYLEINERGELEAALIGSETDAGKTKISFVVATKEAKSKGVEVLARLLEDDANVSVYASGAVAKALSKSSAPVTFGSQGHWVASKIKKVADKSVKKILFGGGPETEEADREFAAIFAEYKSITFKQKNDTKHENFGPLYLKVAASLLDFLEAQLSHGDIPRLARAIILIDKLLRRTDSLEMKDDPTISRLKRYRDLFLKHSKLLKLGEKGYEGIKDKLAELRSGVYKSKKI